jgi:predicted outer membrane repeat protein
MYDNTLISDNFALFGGGVFNDFNCTINMANDSAILDNTATYYGGGVYNWNPYTTTPSLISMTDKASISGNTAASYGGGIQNTDTGLIRISGEAVISNNSALYGGGIYTLSTLPNAVTINGGTIANNTARSGAGIYTNSQLTMTNGIIANNTAVVDGGGMYIGSAGFVELLTGSVYGNVAGNNGGAIGIAYANLDHLFVFDGMVFSNNRASMAYNRNPIDDALYHAQIGANVVWTVQFIQGYNNYDISYTNGTPLAFYTVVYDPGTQGTWQAKDETYLNLDAGVSTPVFGTNSGADFAIDHNAGWRFAGWQPAWSATVSSSVTYVAQWTAGTEPAFYTIRYDGNGYTGGTVPLGGSYPAGYSVLIASQGSMICEGYIFQGWAYSSDAKTPDFDAGSTTYLTLTNDVTLYAVWLKEGPSLMYTVSYLPGAYGTFESVSFVCALGDLTPEAPVVAGQPGWRFIGWAPKPTPTVEGDATYVAQWESEATPTPSPSPTSSPTSTPTRPPTSTPSPTPTRPPTSTPSPTPTPIPTLSPSPSPTASPPGENVDEKPVWALVNLILSVVGVILAIILTLYVLLQRNKKQKNQPTPQQTKDTKRLNSANQTQKNTNNDNDDDHTEVQRKQKQRRLFWFLLSVIMGVVGIVVFLLTEDLSRPMALVDEWTIVDVIILAVQIIAMGFTFKHQKNNNADNTEEPNSSTPTSNTQ